MKTGKLLYIPDELYIKYRGSNTLPLDNISGILKAIIRNEKYSYALLVFKLPIDRTYLESEFEVIPDD
jgi:hypothetical protein